MILKAGWVVPITAPPIRNGFVQISGSRIATVGPAAAAPAGLAECDLGAAVLLPGLINAHTHLELTGYAGMIPPGAFWPWIHAMIRLRAAPGQRARERHGVREGAWSSLRAGVTCVGDISRQNLHWDVLKDLPIRKVCFVELLSLAEDPPRNVAELREAVRAVAEDELLTVGISPHAPYSVPAEQIRDALALAAERQRPWTMHWCETPEEVAFLRDGLAHLPDWTHIPILRCGLRSPARPPMDFLAECVRGARPGLLAHVNYADDAAIESLAEAGHSVAYCPRAHRYFGHPPHPLPRLLAAGIRVVLATDSAASNENLNLLEELRLAARQFPDISAERLFRMVTLDAAAALGGWDDRLGSLEPGKLADLSVFGGTSTWNPAGDHDPLRGLLECGPVQAQAVWVGGKRVF